MVYHVLANVVAVIHTLVVITVVTVTFMAVTGKLVARPKLEAAYYVLMALVIYSDLVLGQCTLTTMEKDFLNQWRPGSAHFQSFLMYHLPFIPSDLIRWVAKIVVIGGLAGALGWRGWHIFRIRQKV